MGTREVYEEKLRIGNMYEYDPTMKPGLGSPRCPPCFSLLDASSEKGEWTITPVLHDATAVAGSGIGGLLSVIHGFNTGIPYVQKHMKGKLASFCYWGYALPRFTQLSVTSYYAVSSTSSYCISLLTRRIEDAYTSHSQHGRLA